MSLFKSISGITLTHNDSGIKNEVVSTIQHPTWIERREIWRMDGSPDVPMHCGYALDGSYIGDVKDARYLEKLGIIPQRRADDLDVASIGFIPETNEWAGWSHRALSRFPTKKQASDFAESVSSVQETSRMSKGNALSRIRGLLDDGKGTLRAIAADDEDTPADAGVRAANVDDLDREWQPVISAARPFFNTLKSIVTHSEGGGVGLQWSQMRLRAGEQQVRIFCTVTARSGSFLPLSVTGIYMRLRSYLTKIDRVVYGLVSSGGVTGTASRADLYVQPQGATRLDIGILIHRDEAEGSL